MTEITDNFERTYEFPKAPEADRFLTLRATWREDQGAWMLEGEGGLAPRAVQWTESAQEAWTFVNRGQEKKEDL